MATCEDENSHKYFEGATWSVGCIQCTCQGGKLTCKRELRLLPSIRETLTEFCNQTNCNVAQYIKTKQSVCKGRLNLEYSCL